MMTRAVYLEHAQSSKGGSYTRKEAEDQWTKWLEDPKVPKDYEGPRGEVQMKVFLKTSIEEYDDIAHERGLKRGQTLNKGMIADKSKMRANLELVMVSGQLDAHEFVDWSSLSHSAADTMAAS
eukprot:6413587-Amphidinium_carterae.1